MVDNAPTDPDSSSSGSSRSGSLDALDQGSASGSSSGTTLYPRPRGSRDDGDSPRRRADKQRVVVDNSGLPPPTRRSGSMDEDDMRSSSGRRRSSRDDGDMSAPSRNTTGGLSRRKGSRDEGDGVSTSSTSSGTAARRGSRDDGDDAVRRTAGAANGRRRGSRDDGDAPSTPAAARGSRGEAEEDAEEDADPSMVRLGPRSMSPLPAESGPSSVQSRKAAAEGEAVARTGNSSSLPAWRAVMADGGSVDINGSFSAGSAPGRLGVPAPSLLMPGPSPSSRRSIQAAAPVQQVRPVSPDALLFRPEPAPLYVPDLREAVYAPAMALVPAPGATVCLHTLTGAPIGHSQPIPLIGPLIITNSPDVFRDTDLVLPYRGKSGLERLAFRLEYITCSAELTTTLQVFNHSRQQRGGASASLIVVNSNQVLGKGDRGVVLKPGDTLSIADRSVTFQLVALPVPHPDPNHSSTALSRYLPSAAAKRSPTPLTPPRPPPAAPPSDTDAPGPALTGAPPLQAAAAVKPRATAEQLAAKRTRAMLISEDFRELAALSRTDPGAAEQQCQELVEAQRTCAGAWLLWAQIASRTRRPALARDLFREAANAAITLASVTLGGGGQRALGSGDGVCHGHGEPAGPDSAHSEYGGGGTPESSGTGTSGQMEGAAGGGASSSSSTSSSTAAAAGGSNTAGGAPPGSHATTDPIHVPLNSIISSSSSSSSS
ncbi:MAG: hypothetical protein WDW36_007969 [Sanguina aurantia]